MGGEIPDKKIEGIHILTILNKSNENQEMNTEAIGQIERAGTPEGNQSR